MKGGGSVLMADTFERKVLLRRILVRRISLNSRRGLTILANRPYIAEYPVVCCLRVRKPREMASSIHNVVWFGSITSVIIDHFTCCLVWIALEHDDVLDKPHRCCCDGVEEEMT